MTEQITTLETTWLSVSEFTQVAGLQQTDVVSLVEVGVLKPIGRTQKDCFHDHAQRPFEEIPRFPDHRPA